jgi:hypothetical protein
MEPSRRILLVREILTGLVNLIRAVRCKFSSTCCKSDCQTKDVEQRIEDYAVKLDDIPE